MCVSHLSEWTEQDSIPQRGSLETFNIAKETEKWTKSKKLQSQWGQKDFNQDSATLNAS